MPEKTTKPVWASKTLWANGVALIGSIAFAFGVDLGLDAQAQASIVTGIMAILNIVLRFTTSKALA